MQKRKTTVHLPNTKQKLLTDQPIIFTAGPIRNALHWQSSALEFFIINDTPALIACPAREIRKDLMKFVAPYDANLEPFPRQRIWEMYYLDEAASKKGVVMFYLAEEKTVKDVPNKTYAHITQLELGELVYMKTLNPDINLVIGIDANYPERDVVMCHIEHRLPNQKVFDTLGECCQEAHTIVMNEYDRGQIFVKGNKLMAQSFEEMVNPVEFAERLYARRPLYLLNSHHSEAKPLYVFTSFTEHAVTYYCTAADKTPREASYADFYRSLMIDGLGNYRPSGFLEEVTEAV